MAGFTEITRRNVISRLACCTDVIVTGETGLRVDGGVIEHHIPVIGVVAGITGLHGSQVVWPHSGCDDTIMTTLASTLYFTMIDSIHRHP